jgi:hypothetical protein
MPQLRGNEPILGLNMMREREPSGIVRSSAVCGDQVLQLGAQERGEKEREERRSAS